MGTNICGRSEKVPKKEPKTSKAGRNPLYWPAMNRCAFGNFEFDGERLTLSRQGAPVPIGVRALALLGALLARRGQTVSKQALMDAAWPGQAVEESNLSVQIAAICRILGPASGGSSWITTVPRGGYRFTDDRPAEPPARPGMPRPTVLVLPFANASGDGAQEYLADAITEDLIFALSKFRWFAVAARATSFHCRNSGKNLKSLTRELAINYVVDGSFQTAGSRLRVSAELVDAAQGQIMWTGRYELDRTDMFAIQDEIAERVAGAIEPELLKSESALVISPHTGNFTTWDLVRRGMYLFHQVGRETHSQAREQFREAARIDPVLPEAHIWLARVNAGIIAYGWSSNVDADRVEGLKAGLEAIRLDDRNAYSHYGLAIISVYSGAFEQAARAAERAIELSHSFALGYLVLGMARLYSGNAAGAISPLQQGLKLSPHDPQNFVWHDLLALALLFAGQPETARDEALKALKIRPSWRTTLEVLAACHTALGELQAAKSYADEARQTSPPATDVLTPLRAANPDWGAVLAHSTD